MQLEILPLAQRDIAEAADYYFKQRAGLDDEFLIEVDAAVVEVLTHPLRFEQVRPGIRRYLLERFPYGIYYRTPNEETVQILVVKHHSRRPGFGMRRK
jgi:plasmid stabilization system protein ParE